MLTSAIQSKMHVKTVLIEFEFLCIKINTRIVAKTNLISKNIRSPTLTVAGVLAESGVANVSIEVVGGCKQPGVEIEIPLFLMGDQSAHTHFGICTPLVLSPDRNNLVLSFAYALVLRFHKSGMDLPGM